MAQKERENVENSCAYYEKSPCNLEPLNKILLDLEKNACHSVVIKSNLNAN